MTRVPAARSVTRLEQPSVLVAYLLFVLIGLAAGANGVLLPAQLADYGVDRLLIGLTFFTNAAGFMAASAVTGPVIERIGFRRSILLGTGTVAVIGLLLGLRPDFLGLVLLQLLFGAGIGLLEGVLNAYLALLPKAQARLGRLHGFFGVGALLGPPLAAGILAVAPWPVVLLVLALLAALLLPAVWWAVPGPAAEPKPEQLADPLAGLAVGRGLLATALRSPTVLLATLLLVLYVGVELGLGNWAFGYLVEARAMPALEASSVVSGYWLGLTLGRFLVAPGAARLGIGTAATMTLCVAGVVAAGAAAWLLPDPVAAAAALLVLGFFLGPIFPLTMVLAPRLAEPRLVPTAIGVINAGSIGGGALLPWLAGVAAEGIGVWTLMPFMLALAVLQLLTWWWLALLLRPRPATAPPSAAG